MELKNFLKKIKTYKIWYFIVRFIIKPIYDFIWLNIINFHGRILYFMWVIPRKKKFNFKNDKYLYENQNLEILVNKIKNDLNYNKISKVISDLQNYKDKSDNLTNSEKKKFKEEIINLLELNTKKETYEFCLSDDIITIVSSYLGLLPILNNITIYINIPKDAEDIRGSMHWHRDDFGYKSLDLFVPITDVDDNNGPFYYVREKEKLGRFINYKNEIKDPVRGDRGKIEEKNFKFSSDDKEHINKFSGKAGNGLFIDSFNNYHKGGHCKKNYRIMLRITYSTVDTHITSEDYYAKSLIDIRKDFNTSKFRNFILNKKSKLISKLKIYKFLTKFYRFLSFRY